MTVGFIGLGSMGGALAERLASGDQDLMVFDRSPDATERLVAAGAQQSANVDDVLVGCDVVHVCLPTSDHVRSVLFGQTGPTSALRSGTTVIDHTTGDPDATRHMARELAAQGVRLVDAPVSGGVTGARAGTIAIMVGADDADFDHIVAALAPISSNVFHAGGVGAGHAIKLVNNLLSCAQRLLTLEAVALAAKNGVEPHAAQEILAASGGRNGYIEKILRPIVLDGDLAAGFTLGLAHKDVRLACELGQHSGVPLRFGDLALDMYQSMIDELGAEEQVDHVALIIDRQSGTSVARAGTDERATSH
jgi:3-hydroxyisobutyrate dehydrogenase